MPRALGRSGRSARAHPEMTAGIAWATVAFHGRRPGSTLPLRFPDRLRRLGCHFARVGPTTPKQYGAKHQMCAHLAVHVPPNSTLEMGAAEMGATIRCPGVGDSPRGTEAAEPLTSAPAPWSPHQLLLTMAWPMFDLGSFCKLVTLDSRTATVRGLSFRSPSLMWFRGRVSVKLLKTGRIRIDYRDHSHWPRRERNR
jgi:hypothetical protein